MSEDMDGHHDQQESESKLLDQRNAVNQTARTEVNCGANMTTFSGKYVDPYNMSPEDVCIEDIAQGLSCMTRFAGQCKSFYSVAQHSVICAMNVLRETNDPRMALIALLHDAPEAYLCDLVRCVKARLPDYRDAEYAVWISVIMKFKLEPLLSYVADGRVAELPEPVKTADFRALVTERRDLITDQTALWDLERTYSPYERVIKPWSPNGSKMAFMEVFEWLTGK